MLRHLAKYSKECVEKVEEEEVDVLESSEDQIHRTLPLPVTHF